jgi:hypothetical protein
MVQCKVTAISCQKMPILINRKLLATWRASLMYMKLIIKTMYGVERNKLKSPYFVRDVINARRGLSVMLLA